MEVLAMNQHPSSLQFQHLLEWIYHQGHNYGKHKKNILSENSSMGKQKKNRKKEIYEKQKKIYIIRKLIYGVDESPSKHHL